MGPDPKILDDIARVAGGAVNIMSGLQQQIREEIKSRVEEVADRLDLVPREDLECAEARIVALEKRMADLEKKIGAKAPAKKSAAKKTTAAKKPAAKKTTGKKTKKS